MVRVQLLTGDTPLMQYEVTAVTARVGWRVFERTCDVLKALDAQEKRQEGRP